MNTSYLSQVLLHKLFVLLAGFRLGKFPLWRLVIHDWSKFLPSEFCTYRRRFTGKEYSQTEWKRAWLHHIHSNPHHWEHWLIKSEPVPMPEIYIREMVIDWLAAGRSYQGSWDIEPWVRENYPKMILHPETVITLKTILLEIEIEID